MATELTKPQLLALLRIRFGGPSAWCDGTKSRAGGAISRMFNRLVARGYVTGPPYQLTAKGRQATAHIDMRKIVLGGHRG